MATSSEVLKEFLISLGFKVDPGSEKKFDESILSSSKKVLGMAGAAVGAAAAVNAMVVSWAQAMEKMYYASRKAESSVGNLQALQFASKMVGVSAESMQGALEGMARQMRLNPGLQGLIESFGIKVTGRQKADVMIDLLDKLKSFPFYVQAQFANLFGMNPDDLLLLQEGTDKFKEMIAARKALAEKMGVDPDEAARIGLEVSQQWDQLNERIKLLKDNLNIALSGPVKSFQKGLAAVLEEAGAFIGRMNAEAKRTPVPEGVTNMGLLSLIGKGIWNYLRLGTGTPTIAADRRSSGTVNAPAASKDSERAAKISAWEQQNGLPPGMLMSVFGMESHYGDPRYMLSKKGAKGPFGVMPDTAKEYDIFGKEMDFDAAGPAMAKKLAHLLQFYGGDQRLAAAAYNWGEGNLAKVGNDINKAPAETRAYADAVGGRAPVVIQQETNIYVATDDPETAGKSVAREQVRVGADIMRNAAGQGIPR